MVLDLIHCPSCGRSVPSQRAPRVCFACGWKASDEPPIARTGDPATSHEGARKITESGKRRSVQARILAVLMDAPGGTVGEVTDVLDDLTQYQVSKRMSDLKNHGKVRPDGTREWRGNQQQRWWPVHESRDPEAPRLMP